MLARVGAVCSAGSVSVADVDRVAPPLLHAFPPLSLRSYGHIPRYLSPLRNTEQTAEKRGQTSGYHGKNRPQALTGFGCVQGARFSGSSGGADVRRTVMCALPV